MSKTIIIDAFIFASAYTHNITEICFNLFRYCLYITWDTEWVSRTKSYKPADNCCHNGNSDRLQSI